MLPTGMISTESGAALKEVYFIVRHNLPLDLFADLVELSVDLGASRLRGLHAGKKDTNTSTKTVHRLLRSSEEEVSTNITNSIQQSPTFSMKADKVMLSPANTLPYYIGLGPVGACNNVPSSKC